MELVLVRHALPVRVGCTPDGTPVDPVLAELGHQQAQRVLHALEHDEVTALYTSPAARARATATPLANALRLGTTVEAGLSEFDVDETSYVPVEELRAADDPRVAAAVWLAIVGRPLYRPACLRASPPEPALQERPAGSCVDKRV